MDFSLSEEHRIFQDMIPGFARKELAPVARQIARASAKIEAARCLSYYAAWLEMHGRPCRIAASQAKMFASEVCQEVAAEAMQIFGGYGMSNEYDIGRFFRDSRVFTVGEGTTEIHVGILARELGL